MGILFDVDKGLLTGYDSDYNTIKDNILSKTQNS